MAQNTATAFAQQLERRIVNVETRRPTSNTLAALGWVSLGALCMLALVCAALWWPGRAAHGRDDELFARFPLSKATLLNSAAGPGVLHPPVDVPFHAYGARAVMVHCSLALGAVQATLRATRQDFSPVQTSDGRALGVLWLVSYNDSVAGPYNEVVVTLAVTPGQAAPLVLECASTDPFCTLKATFAEPRVVSLALKLWLDSQLAVDYGIQLFGCNKVRVDVRHAIVEGETWHTTVPGSLHVRLRLPSLRYNLLAFWDYACALVSMVRTVGLLPVLRLALTMPYQMDNRLAMTAGLSPLVPPETAPLVLAAMRPSPSLLLRWRPASAGAESAIEFDASETLFAGWDFRAALVQVDYDLRFVMMSPVNAVVSAGRRP